MGQRREMTPRIHFFYFSVNMGVRVSFETIGHADIFIR